MNGLLRATSKFTVCSTPNSKRGASQPNAILPHPISSTHRGSWEGTKPRPPRQLGYSERGPAQGLDDKSSAVSEPQGINMGSGGRGCWNAGSQRPGGWPQCIEGVEAA